MQNKKPSYYRVNQAAKICEVHPNTIYRWIQNGTLHAVMVGGEYRISDQDIQRLFNGVKGGENDN